MKITKHKGSFKKSYKIYFNPYDQSNVLLAAAR